jgi:uncharacterized protein (TIGR00255 family)
MICSMTGFASARRDVPGGTLSAELRSVNHRYLDLQLRLPEDLRPLEPALRELLVPHVRRGKIECRVAYAPLPAATRNFELNTEMLKELRSLSEKLRMAWPSVPGLTASDILHWPGMLAADEVPLEELRASCQQLLLEVVAEFNATRAREGEKLKEMLLERAAAMEQLITAVEPRMPQVIAAYQEKLTARLREALAVGDEERIRQEIALFAHRIDVAEELSRLNAHIAEVRRVLAAGGAAGKRLDFLMQELNREANTLGSKSADLEVSRVAMELKLLIEQMREQIQNIE